MPNLRSIALLSTMLLVACTPDGDTDCDALLDSGAPVEVEDAGHDAGHDAGAPECTTAGQCDDVDPCTDDSCVAGSCAHTQNGAPCDDTNACTHEDRCSAGTCAGVVYGCSTESGCAESVLPQQIGTRTGCVPSLAESGVTCVIPDGCGTGREGCPVVTHASAASATYFTSPVAGQPGRVRVTLTLDDVNASYNYADQCIFHGTLAPGASVAVTMDLTFEQTDVCGGSLRYTTVATALTGGTVNVTATPINGTGWGVCLAYIGAVDQPTRRQITDIAVAEYLERINVVCGACSGCTSGIRCEPMD